MLATLMNFGIMIIGILAGIVLGMIVFYQNPVAEAKKINASTEYLTEQGATEKGLFDKQRIVSIFSPLQEGFVNTIEITSATSSLRSISIPVMIYHSVRPYREGESKYQDAYDVTPELLEQELQYMKEKGFHTVTFAAVIAFFDHGIPLPMKPVILSFDDGWKNQFVYAYPLLQKYGMTGTFFIFSNPIDYQKPQWMSWDDIVTLDHSGMEIGGHSRTHPILTKIETDALLDKEILESKHIVESHLGHPIVAFAYPFGAFNTQTKAAVVRAGYLVARTVNSGVWNDPAHRMTFHGTLSSDRFADFERLLHINTCSLEEFARISHTYCMAIDATIDPQIQILLQYADEEVLVHTIWALSAEQKRSHIFKQLGEQRYLSSLRAGAIDNAEMTKLAFKMDPFFLKSRVVNEAAWAGHQMQIELGRPDIATKIEQVMGLPEDLSMADSAGIEIAKSDK